MSGMNEVAKESGVNPVECSHCGRKTYTDRVLSRFFQVILDRVAKGETVHIKNFGTFEAKELKGRKYKKPLNNRTDGFEDQLVLRFRQSLNAKNYLNGWDLEDEDTEETEDEQG